MQTFLPYSDYKASAKVLDWRRLGKQRVECFQLLIALGHAESPTANALAEMLVPLRPKASSWVNHPCAKMWRGHEAQLALYMQACIDEWVARGYNNTMQAPLLLLDAAAAAPKPPWLGDERLHSTHRSNLLRKDPVHYGQFGWTEPPDLEYFWPSKEPQYATL